MCVCVRQEARAIILISRVDESLLLFSSPHHPAVVPLIDEVRGQKCAEDTARGVCIYAPGRERGKERGGNLLP